MRKKINEKSNLCNDTSNSTRTSKTIKLKVSIYFVLSHQVHNLHTHTNIYLLQR